MRESSVMVGKTNVTVGKNNRMDTARIQGKTKKKVEKDGKKKVCRFSMFYRDL